MASKHLAANPDYAYICRDLLFPHPYPKMVRTFAQSVIGREIREQSMAQEGRLPNMLIAVLWRWQKFNWDDP